MSTGSVAVVDSWSILAFLRAEEPGAAAMRRYLRRARAGNLRLLLNVVNLGDVFYRLIQLTGVTQAEERLAEIKAAHRLAYADAFAVATGRAESAPIITGDPEILALPAAVIRARKLERNT